MAGFGKRIVGLGAVPSVINTADGRNALGGDAQWIDGQVFVRPDHPYPIVRFMFWDQSKGGNGGLYVNAKGVVRPSLLHSDLTKGSHGVKCDDSQLVKPSDPHYDPQTSWHDAMDFAEALHMAQNMQQIRIDHICGIPKSVSNADDMAFYALKIVGIDVEKDNDLPNGWRQAWDTNSDLSALVKHAIKVKRFDTIKKLREDGVKMNSGRWIIPPNMLAYLSAGNVHESERKIRQQIHQRVVQQLALWNELRDLFVKE